MPVEKEDGILSLVEVCQSHPLQDGVVDIEVTLSIRRLFNGVQLVTFFLENHYWIFLLELCVIFIEGRYYVRETCFL